MEAGLRQALNQALYQAVAHRPNKQLELEFRLGRCINNRFVPGVSKIAWTKMQDALSSCPSVRTQQPVDIMERIYSDTGTALVVTDSSRMWKRKVPLFKGNDDDGTVRGALAWEEWSGKEPAGAARGESFIRKKQRQSFLHECWSFDLTKVISNHPDQMDNDEETYEVEIEFVDNNYFFKYTVDHLVAWGALLARQLRDLGVSSAATATATTATS